MKVFLSWSGEISHKVAIVFRDWLPNVIQVIEPYVSSEDIEKGTRWSTDIAQELEDSSFGILCVTKENIETPWLNFEAGALSKTMENSYVSPFLFDIKRSEVKGPILQFQSTIFEKEDIKKLILTLNKACEGSILTEDRISKTFDVWYSDLEEQLSKIKSNIPEPETKKEQNVSANVVVEEKGNIVAVSKNEEILEEILFLSRTNQKILRTPDKSLEINIVEIKQKLEELRLNSRKEIRNNNRRRRKLKNPMILEELIHMSTKFENNFMGFQITLSLLKNDFPWVYDAGIELSNQLKKKISEKQKYTLLENFNELLEFTFRHPIMRELYKNDDEDSEIIGRELPRILMRSLEKTLHH